MKRKTIIAVALLCLSLGAQAQLLWEISGKDLKSPSYLFGTHHAIPLSYLDSVDHLFKYYNQCSMVVGEVVLDAEKSNQRILSAATMNERLDKLLSAEDYALVDSVCQQIMGIPLAYLNNYRPSVVSNMLEMAIYEAAFPNGEADQQMDSFFQLLAERQGNPVQGLESIDDQIDLLFRSQSMERQLYLLVGVAKSVPTSIESYNTLNNLYKNGDIDGLLDLFLSDTTEYKPTVGEVFLFLEQRNRQWVDKLPELMRANPCFIAVGAMHLPGETGVIELLKKRGYKVKAVKK